MDDVLEPASPGGDCQDRLDDTQVPVNRRIKVDLKSLSVTRPDADRACSAPPLRLYRPMIVNQGERLAEDQPAHMIIGQEAHWKTELEIR
jgi:hypothetical protein